MPNSRASFKIHAAATLSLIGLLGLLASSVDWASRPTKPTFGGRALSAPPVAQPGSRGVAAKRPPAAAFGPVSPNAATQARLRAGYAKLPLSFEANRGQTAQAVRFLSRGRGYTLFLTPSEAVLSLRRPAPRQTQQDFPEEGGRSDLQAPRGAVMRLKLAGANPTPEMHGLEELPGKSNYFIGHDPAKWRKNIPSYAKVRYREVYPGVDLVYYGNQRQLEYDFVVSPGADPGRIQLVFEGIEQMRLEAGGDLILRTEGGEIRQRKPVVYQEIDGSTRRVPSRYVLRGENAVGFEITEYDAGKPLVIDPVLVYSTFLGGSAEENTQVLLNVAGGIAVDSSGNAYVTGYTTSTDFPTMDPLQPDSAGNADAFLAKLDPTGSALLFSTYFGGAQEDKAYGIAVDSADNVYVAGETSSADFPTVNPFQATCSSCPFVADVFVAKLDAGGASLLYSTFFGADAEERATSVAVDSAGNAYVTGRTSSAENFPILNGFQLDHRGGQFDAFAAKFDPAQPGDASLLYSTYIGGSGNDAAFGIAVDASGNAYITGGTSSMDDFPVSAGAFQSLFGGVPNDAFVTKLDPSQPGFSSFIYSTFLGGSGVDRGNSIVVDAAGNACIAGRTGSFDLPVRNPLQTDFGGGTYDAFVAKVNDTGTDILYSTYLGGSVQDDGFGIASDADGNCYVTGSTSSPDFPTVNPLQTDLAGGTDAFVVMLDPAGTAFVYSTFFGGTGNDSGNGIAVDAARSVYLTGDTTSPDFPTANAFQPAYGGGATDAFVAKIGEASPPSFTVGGTPGLQVVAPGDSAIYTVEVTPAGGFTGDVAFSVSGLPDGASASSDPPLVSITDETAQSATLTVTTSMDTSLDTYTLTIFGTSEAMEQSVSVSLVVTSSSGIADMSITNTGSPNPVTVGTNLTYSLNIVNSGPGMATNVVATDVLPSEVIFVSASSAQGTCSGTDTVVCDIGMMVQGGGASITIVVTPQTTGQITNTATVRANELDPDSSNDIADSVTTVEPAGAGPVMFDPNLAVTTLAEGLVEPTGMAFLAPNDILVIEKRTGKVQRVVDGLIQDTVLDLAVNFASERGLLGIALHPDFSSNGFVYLFWTCHGPVDGDCEEGLDTSNVSLVPLLGNRVDRFVWDGTTLTFDANLITLRAYQQDADASGDFNQPPRGNHNGGVLRFGYDGKLYVLFGDVGRRGWMQNIAAGALPDGTDDQFGGPEPDNAHLSGVILRLNDDGTTPKDNPFFDAGVQIGGEAGANVQKVFAYGVRNGFGMAFDPFSGLLWTQENGDDTYDRINLVQAGANNGWVQLMAPPERMADYKTIETGPRYRGLQQVRWPPELLADTPDDAMAQLFMLPNAYFNSAPFSWRFAVAPSPIGFMQGQGLGTDYEGDLFVGASRTTLAGGYLFRFKLTADRLDIVFGDAVLEDRVADNLDKFDITESESLLIGRDFGITTDIQTGPHGNLFVLSLSKGAIYEISANQSPAFLARGKGQQLAGAINSGNDMAGSSELAVGRAGAKRNPLDR